MHIITADNIAGPYCMQFYPADLKTDIYVIFSHATVKTRVTGIFY